MKSAFRPLRLFLSALLLMQVLLIAPVSAGTCDASNVSSACSTMVTMLDSNLPIVEDSDVGPSIQTCLKTVRNNFVITQKQYRAEVAVLKNKGDKNAVYDAANMFTQRFDAYASGRHRCFSHP